MAQKYYVGLDMGTASVGWAVTDDKYNIIKKHGKALWGVRLFKTADTAEGRRTFRAARRRTQRKKQRIELLQEIFSDEISKIDMGFYQRIKESKYWLEDKRDINGNQPELPYTLFGDAGFTDKDYHEQFPTVFHLRNILVNEWTQKYDIRLVYLAIHHIIKHRGHFLFEGKKMSEVTDFSSAFETFCKVASDNDIEITVDEENIKDIGDLLKSRQKSKTAKKQELGKLIAGTDKQKKALTALVTGCTVKLSEIFADNSLDDVERSKISFADSNYDEYIADVEETLAERFLLITAGKTLYDWAVLSDILEGSTYISEAKVKIYEKHKADLRKLKDLLKTRPDEYKRIFGLPEKQANYSAYIGMVKKNGKKVPIDKKCTKADFYSFLKKTLNKISFDDAKESEIAENIINEIENETFLPKQIISDNGVIPYQLHEAELNLILKNAVLYYPFLEKKDEDGYTNIEKIQSIFKFRIPYYVGPLNTYHSDKGGNSWAVRKQDGKIYPWNFESKIDAEESARKFIGRMTNKCTYLIGKDVLPKESLLYSKFMVLNELNNLRIDGEKVSVEIKQAVYENVFKKYQRVTGKKVKDFLIRNGIIEREQELSGVDQNFKSSLKSYHDIKQIAGDINLSQSQKEDIIKDITVFADSQKMLKKRLKIKYPELSDKQVTQLAAKKYTGWGRLSREFLEEVESVNKETGEVLNIISALWETNENLMQLLSNKYDYLLEIKRLNDEAEDKSEVITYDDVQKLYVSPAVKRPVWQTLKIVEEISKIMGSKPERIFVEMAREPGQKGDVKVSRKSRLLEEYKYCKKEAPEIYENLVKEDDNKLRSDKLFLYYTQMGRCMYSNEVIDIEDLFTNRYDIDHIYPQSKVMDDSLDNRVLVKRELNSSKTDVFPVPKEYMDKSKTLWDMLKKKDLISKEKYHRLTRRDGFSENELSGFIARQLVETRQSTKAVTQLLTRAYPESEIVYAKANAVSEFRHKFKFTKVRSINDYHHAKDAYLNIVVGNTYYVKFTKDAAWFVRNNPGRTYNLKKMFEQGTVSRGGETAWVSGDNGTIVTVNKVMRKNNILFTRKAYEVRGGLFDQQIMKKGKGQIPIKNNSGDDRLRATEKYGAYNKASGAYFMLVESEDKRGNKIRTLEFVPVYLAKELEKSENAAIRYCVEKLELKNPDIRIRKIKMDSLFNVDGFRMHLSGRTEKRLLFKGAEQLVLDEESQKILKKTAKVSADYKENKNIKISDKMELTDEMLIKLYELFYKKLKDTVYNIRLSTQIKTLESGKEKFEKLSLLEKCLVIEEILHLFQCQSVAANLSSVGGAAKAGILVLNNEISRCDKVEIINQSITGFYEQVIDLKTI